MGRASFDYDERRAASGSSFKRGKGKIKKYFLLIGGFLVQIIFGKGILSFINPLFQYVPEIILQLEDAAYDSIKIYISSIRLQGPSKRGFFAPLLAETAADLSHLQYFALPYISPII
jgi:hypothetical protein